MLGFLVQVCKTIVYEVVLCETIMYKTTMYKIILCEIVKNKVHDCLAHAF